MKNRGTWIRYTPEVFPPGTDANIYFHRLKDTDPVLDWYEWSREFYGVENGADTTGTTKVALAGGWVVSVVTDITSLGMTGEFTLMEMESGDTVPTPGMRAYADGDNLVYGG